MLSSWPQVKVFTVRATERLRNSTAQAQCIAYWIGVKSRCAKTVIALIAVEASHDITVTATPPRAHPDDPCGPMASAGSGPCDTPLHRAGQPVKIGRASCRER